MNIDSIQNVCVIGLGKSGFALCKLLLELKKKVFLSESKPAESFSPVLRNALTQRGVACEFGGHSERFLQDAQLFVLSPGVDPLTSEAVKIAQIRQITFVGEIEFAFWLTKAKFVAITGTNGKTTTTFLTYRVLKEMFSGKKRKVFLGGNIGIPISSFILDTREGDIVVVEISSFQLETIIEFRPHVACLLNIDPNHLDRHPTFKDYFEAKMNIFRNQRSEDFAVLNKKITMLPDIEKRLRAKKLHFSSEFPNENHSCVYRATSAFGATKLDCMKVFSSFKGLPHRMQQVRRVNEVTFVNDSKSTNPSSTVWALKNIKGQVILIAGGKDKGVQYQAIVPFLKRVKKINLFGQAACKINDALSPHARTEVFATLEAVVQASYAQAQPGDTVLFSPMCSSFDMFSNYMERGRLFTAVVKRLDDTGCLNHGRLRP